MNFLTPPDNFRETFWDTVTNILFLMGIVIIELVIRPWFGEGGVPFLPNVIMVLGDMVLIIGLIRKNVEAARGVVVELIGLRNEFRGNDNNISGDD